MRDREKRDIVRSVFLALWSMATVILFFCVLLLAHEMLQRGQDPVDALIPQPAAVPEAAAPERLTNTLGAREISLFFVGADGRSLIEEHQTIDYSDSTVENCRLTLQRLIEGSAKGNAPILPENTKIHAIYFLEDGELVVDLSRELITEMGRFKSASTESLLVYGIVNTLSQPALQGKNEPAVRYVRLLLEGQAPAEAFPAHLELTGPIEPDRTWIGGGLERGNA